MFLKTSVGFSEEVLLNEYQKMLYENVESLNQYKTGLVFLEKMNSDGLFIYPRDGNSKTTIVCYGRSEKKYTILLSGVEKESLGVKVDERYYQLEEKKFFLKKGEPNYSRCKEYFGAEIAKIDRIKLKKKKLVSLLNFKKINNDDWILGVHKIDKKRLEVTLEPRPILGPSPYCGPRGVFIEEPRPKTLKLDDLDAHVITYDLSRPWEFAKEKIYRIKDKGVKVTLEKLPRIHISTIYEKIKDVEVDFGDFTYTTSRHGCLGQVQGPKKTWREIYERI